MFKDLLVTRSSLTSHRALGQDHIADGHSRLLMSTPAFEGVFRRFTMNRVLTEPPVAHDVRERLVFDAADAGRFRLFDFLARRDNQVGDRPSL